ncbi:glutamate 5-kinase [Anaerolineales bacterium HSG24]|nr:glutamate 5-kinase [Anaerolineales bacterium HSG24]
MRIVIKVGTNVLRGGTEGIHRPRLIDLARQIARLSELGHEPVLVSSGAVFAGQELLGVMPPKRKKDIPHRQMLAAVGQGRLLALYQQIFELYSLKVAQALLTRGDLANRNRYLNARNSLLLLLQHRVVPIINENDVVAVDEIKFGDNDNLSALVANLINADLLVILTDQKGLFTADPRRDDSAKLIPEVKTIDDTILAMAGDVGHVGTGGMTTKLEAAQLATRSGTDVVIAPGSEPDVVLRVVEGQAIGTRFPTQLSHVESRKRWILTERVQGTIIIDAGAAKALVESGKSLLAVGVVEVKRDFPRGATVSVLNTAGQELGRGVANYKSADLHAIFGQQSHHIARILGYDYGATVIHRDDMVIQ